MVWRVITGPFSTTENGGISQYLDKGIMFGVIFLYGVPGAPEGLSPLLTEREAKFFINSFDKTEKAIETMLKLLGLQN